MVAVHDGTANININNVINVVKCTKCKWFTGLVIEDECGYYYGYCNAIQPEIMLGERDAEDNAPCDFYVKDNNDDTTA